MRVRSRFCNPAARPPCGIPRRSRPHLLQEQPLPAGWVSSGVFPPRRTCWLPVEIHKDERLAARKNGGYAPVQPRSGRASRLPPRGDEKTRQRRPARAVFELASSMTSARSNRAGMPVCLPGVRLASPSSTSWPKLATPCLPRDPPAAVVSVVRSRAGTASRARAAAPPPSRVARRRHHRDVHSLRELNGRIDLREHGLLDDPRV